MKKILLLGGTGAMGIYLVPELLNMGFDVFVTSRSARESPTADTNGRLAYIQGNAHDREFIEKTLAPGWDAIVDFMVYSTNEFRARHDLLLKNTGQYIFISSCRVFAESSVPVTEKTPRLLDVCKDAEYLATDEYALAKAREEDILRASQYKNWTIARPTITYSKGRFQLGTLEAGTILYRAANACPVILPKEMLAKKTAMTWGGDVAKMLAGLVLNQNALGEDFNVCTSEYKTWKEIAEYYKRLIGLKVVPTSLKKYMNIVGGKYQILYSRMFNRAFDNSKILKTTGMKQENFMSIYDGLKKELVNTLPPQEVDYIYHGKIDRIAHSRIPLENAGKKEKILYFAAYMGVIKALLFLKSIRRKVLQDEI